jgi:predicted AAA+ superfamily ATPase
MFSLLLFSMLCGSSNEWVTSHSEREFPMKEMVTSSVSAISLGMLMLLAKNIIDEEYAYYKLKKNAIKIKKNNSSKNNSSYELFGFLKEKNILEYYINILVNKLPSYNGVLLYGKPGNGKSTLINYISD